MTLTQITRRDADLRQDAVELRRGLSALIRVYGFRDRDRICCHDVSVTQAHGLAGLVEEGPLTLNELAAWLYLDKSTTSRVVDGLEKKGYAERRENPESRRSILVAATADGVRLHGRIEEALLHDEMQLLAGFDPEVRRAAAQLVGQLARAAAARVDTTGGTCCSVP